MQVNSQITLIEARINRLSEICADIGQVCLASIVIPFLIDKDDSSMIILGLFSATGSWILSLLLVRK